MAAIRGKSNKSTEVLLRMALVRAGIRGWTLHPAITGKPDFYFPKERIAMFVDGCFWHGCPWCGHIPSTRRLFWRAKIDRNKWRDRRNVRILRECGVRSLRVWEHSLCGSGSVNSIIAKIRCLRLSRKFLRQPR